MDHYRSLYLRLIKPSTNTLVANGYVGNVRRMVFEVQICGARNDRSVIVCTMAPGREQILQIVPFTRIG